MAQLRNNSRQATSRVPPASAETGQFMQTPCRNSYLLAQSRLLRPCIQLCMELPHALHITRTLPCRELRRDALICRAAGLHCSRRQQLQLLRGSPQQGLRLRLSLLMMQALASWVPRPGPGSPAARHPSLATVAQRRHQGGQMSTSAAACSYIMQDSLRP